MKTKTTKKETATSAKAKTSAEAKTSAKAKTSAEASSPKKAKHLRLLWSHSDNPQYGVRASAGSLIYAHMIDKAGKWVSLKELDRFRLAGQSQNFVDHRLAKFDRLLSAGSGPKSKMLFVSGHLEYSVDGQQARFQSRALTFDVRRTSPCLP